MNTFNMHNDMHFFIITCRNTLGGKISLLNAEIVLFSYGINFNWNDNTVKVSIVYYW